MFLFSKVYRSTHWHIETIDIWVPGLHLDTAANRKRMRLFWAAFAAMFIFEIIPSYIFPFLNGINIFCLASQHASPGVQDVFTNIFGGAGSNEGLGLFSLSFDWQYIGSELVPSAGHLLIHAELYYNSYMSLPLIQQVNSWIGMFFCYIAILAIYYSDTWNVTEHSFH
jgi:hypothetical protein